MRQMLDVLGRYAQIRVYAVLILIVSVFVALCAGLVIGGHFGYGVGREVMYEKIFGACKKGDAVVIGDMIIVQDWRKRKDIPLCEVWERNRKREGE